MTPEDTILLNRSQAMRSMTGIDAAGLAKFRHPDGGVYIVHVSGGASDAAIDLACDAFADRFPRFVTPVEGMC